MRKIDIKSSLDERVQSTEWTDKNTWNVLDRIRKPGKTPENRRFPVLIPIAAALILALCIGIASVANRGTQDLIRESIQTMQPLAQSGRTDAYDESVRRNMENTIPGLADELVPVDFSTEHQGIRLEIHSALVKGQDAYILFSVRDLEDDRISTALGYFSGFTDGTGAVYEHTRTCLMGASPGEHMVTYLECYTTDSASASEGRGSASMSVSDLRFYGKIYVDLLPLVKQYAPEDGEGTAEVDVPLYRTVSLTGIGWTDGKLHLRMDTGDGETIRPDSIRVSCSVTATDENGVIHEENRQTDRTTGGESEETPQWAEFTADAAPDETDRLVLSAEFTDITDTADGTWEVRFPVAMIRDEEAAQPAGLSCEEIVLGRLKNMYPKVAETLKPVHYASEHDGVRMEVVSALVTGRESWALCTLEDLEGTRITDSTCDIFHRTNNIGKVDSYPDYFVYCSTEEHKIAYVEHIEYYRMNLPEDGFYTFGINSVCTSDSEVVDLIPLLKEYGETVDGIDPPKTAALYSGYYEKPAPAGMKLLDYTDPLDIPLSTKGNVTLTGIGWIDNKLHVQIHEAEPDFVITMENMTARTFCVGVYNYRFSGELIDYADVSPLGWEGGGGKWDRWSEFVVESTPEDADRMKLTAELFYQSFPLTGDWEVRVPVSLIRPEEE